MKKFKVSWNIDWLTELKEAEIVDEMSRLVMYADVCRVQETKRSYLVVLRTTKTQGGYSAFPST